MGVLKHGDANRFSVPTSALGSWGEIACGDFAGHQLCYGRQKAWLDAHPLQSPQQPSTSWQRWAHGLLSAASVTIRLVPQC
jgi:hypothetical protein